MSKESTSLTGARRSVLCLLSAGLFAACPALPVDFSTLQGKVLFGYQGWFDCPMGGKGSWTHWSKGAPSATTLTIEMYPDVSELPPQDLCPAGGMTVGGKQAYLFSSLRPAVIDAHFKWMEQNDLDGVLVQRFFSRISNMTLRNSADAVLKNIIAAAVAHGRTFAIEYDLTGGNPSTFTQLVQNDWKYLVDDLKVTANPNYLRHNGRPVVSFWGLGMRDAGVKDPVPVQSFIQWFKNSGPEKYRVTYMGGTAGGWRTLASDSDPNPAWTSAYNSMDVIQPWTVGRYSDTNGVANWGRTHYAPDVAATKANGSLYMPVVFPGFSWFNLHQGKQNQIPRLGGKFLWRQAYEAKKAGATMLKFAMFDEVDEGTAMFKVVSKRSQAPDQGYWLALDADGYDLPSDWYLRLAGEIAKMFHGTRPLTAAMPLDPAHPAAGVVSQRADAGSPGLQASIGAGGFLIQSENAEGTIRILSLSGAELCALRLSGGRALWDGRDRAGNRAGPGVYWAMLKNSAGTGSMPLVVR